MVHLETLRRRGVGFCAGPKSGHTDHWHLDLRDWRDACPSARRGDCRRWEKVKVNRFGWRSFISSLARPELRISAYYIHYTVLQWTTPTTSLNNVLVQGNFTNRLSLYPGAVSRRRWNWRWNWRGTHLEVPCIFFPSHASRRDSCICFRGSINDKQWDPESPQVVDNVVLQCLALYCWRWSSWTLNWFGFWFPPCRSVSKFSSPICQQFSCLQSTNSIHSIPFQFISIKYL